jgi:hypothetical protein
MRNSFNDSLSVAFLLDNIGEFVADRGSKTIFGAMDAKELKATPHDCKGREEVIK